MAELEVSDWKHMRVFRLLTLEQVCVCVCVGGGQADCESETSKADGGQARVFQGRRSEFRVA